jgi:hypothetical protein
LAEKIQINRSTLEGERKLVTVMFADMAGVYVESGRKEEALGNLKKAETMFRDVGMDWLTEAQEALAKL